MRIDDLPSEYCHRLPCRQSVIRGPARRPGSLLMDLRPRSSERKCVLVRVVVESVHPVPVCQATLAAAVRMQSHPHGRPRVPARTLFRSTLPRIRSHQICRHNPCVVLSRSGRLVSASLLQLEKAERSRELNNRVATVGSTRRDPASRASTPQPTDRGSPISGRSLRRPAGSSNVEALDICKAQRAGNFPAAPLVQEPWHSNPSWNFGGQWRWKRPCSSHYRAGY